MAARARYKRRRLTNRAGIVWASIVVLILVTVVSVKSIGLMQKARDYQEKEQQLLQQIEYENQRSEDIAEFERRFIEKHKHLKCIELRGFLSGKCNDYVGTAADIVGMMGILSD